MTRSRGWGKEIRLRRGARWSEVSVDLHFLLATAPQGPFVRRRFLMSGFAEYKAAVERARGSDRARESVESDDLEDDDER